MTFNKVRITVEKAYARYVDSIGAPDCTDLLNQIVDTAYATGHWEVWFDVFGQGSTPYVLKQLQERCKQAHIENSL